MKRKQSWPEDLNAYIDSVRGKPFVWGGLDCCLFPAGAVLAMTGIDPAAPFRGHYSDAESAMTALFAYCGGALPEMMAQMAREFDWKQIEIPYLQRGDVVLVPGTPGVEGEQFRGLLGVCVGPMTAVLAHAGLLLIANKHIRSAWRI